MKVDSWCGIPLIPDQDAGIQEGMKPILDRSKEHLGRADLAVVHMRATMLESIKAVQRGGHPVGIGSSFPADQICCVVEVVPADVPRGELGCRRRTRLSSLPSGTASSSIRRGGAGRIAASPLGPTRCTSSLTHSTSYACMLAPHANSGAYLGRPDSRQGSALAPCVAH